MNRPVPQPEAMDFGSAFLPDHLVRVIDHVKNLCTYIHLSVFRFGDEDD